MCSLANLRLMAMSCIEVHLNLSHQACACLTSGTAQNLLSTWYLPIKASFQYYPLAMVKTAEPFWQSRVVTAHTWPWLCGLAWECAQCAGSSESERQYAYKKFGFEFPVFVSLSSDTNDHSHLNFNSPFQGLRFQGVRELYASNLSSWYITRL